MQSVGAGGGRGCCGIGEHSKSMSEQRFHAARSAECKNIAYTGLFVGCKNCIHIFFTFLWMTCHYIADQSFSNQKSNQESGLYTVKGS